MKILGIESASLTASAAIWEDDLLTAEYTVNYKKTHSQTLLPMIDEIVTMTETDLETLDAIAVSGGPGSFTGLRIGSATAKGLGLALQKPLIHVPTLDAMAYEHFGTDRVICPMLDARRSQVYCGLYEHHDEFKVLKPQAALTSSARIAGEKPEQARACVPPAASSRAWSSTQTVSGRGRRMVIPSAMTL